MDFYERVKYLVKSKCLAMTTFVESCGIDYNTYKGCKRQGLLPRADVVVKMAQQLGTTSEYLVTGQHPYNRELEQYKAKVRSFLEELT